MAAIEVPIHQDARGREIEAHAIDRQDLVMDTMQKRANEASLRMEGGLIRLLAELQPANEIAITRDYRTEFAVNPELLKISFRPGTGFAQIFHQLLFPRHDAVC